ncbi:HD domain-containing phosphohydrolase [Marinobacter zhejiangensis]|uniref:HD domain-containing phosphohydrolase n=1 Tax=Marinobacter zhejiangensis TaxID=488535 RepID=UPI001FE17F3B|nr:HD domain-containing phosphohydrolase [Marinobacter zhejiangensis]
MNPQRRQRAQISLALLIATSITLGMLVLALVLIIQSFRGLEAAKLTAARDTTEQLASAINDRLDAITKPQAIALRILADDPMQFSTTLDERLERLPVFASILQENDLVTSIYSGFADGEFFLLRRLRESDSTFFPDAPANSAFMLRTITWLPPGIMSVEIHFYDEQLRPLQRQALRDYDFDPRSRQWYRLAMESERTILTSPYVFFSTREIGLTLARRSMNGTLVNGIDVTVTELSDKLADLRLTPGTQLAVVNENNGVIAYSSPNSLGSNATDPHALTDLALLPDPTLSLIAHLSDQAEVMSFDSLGRTFYGFSVELDALSSDNLRIVIAIPADELLADAWASLALQTRIAAAIAVLLLILGWFLGNQVGKPLEHLTDRVGALSRFRFDTSVKVDSRIREASKLGTALDDMAKTIRSFQNIALTLNRSKNLDELLKEVLEHIIHIVGEKRGAIYLYARNAEHLNLAVNEGLSLTKQIDKVSRDADDNDIIHQLRTEISGHPIFAILRNRQKNLVGVLVIEMESGDQTRLSNDLIVFVDEIAGSAAVAIETRELIENQQALLDGIIRLVANAIDTKSPYTSGHCERVPQLARMLVDAAQASNEPAFQDFYMTEDEAYEFHLASWLHDCGKITSPEYVVDKSTKLETLYNRIHEIRTRFEVLHRDAEIRYLKDRLNGLNPEQARNNRDLRQQELQQQFAMLADANIGGEFMSENDIAQVRLIAEQTWQRHFSDRLGLSRDELHHLGSTAEPSLPATEKLLDDKPQHLSHWGDRIPPVTRGDPRNKWGFDMELPSHAQNRGEVYNLTIQRGTLTPEERFKINEHIVQTICMLDALPLPDRLANVPRLAGTHHERMDGKGYPCGLRSKDMGVPEKVMAVADIFEALTATDRPYKDGKTLTEALGIMVRMVAERHIDGDVFRLFVLSGVYRQYAEAYLSPAQIDKVDEEALLEPLYQMSR